MNRRYFEFLYSEICVAIHRRVSRYGLWLLVAELATTPSDPSQRPGPRFLEDCVDALLTRENEDLSPRARRRLQRRLLAFDPRYPTPEEWLLGLTRRAGT